MNYLAVLLLLLFFTNSQAQTSGTYPNDLTELRNLLEKTHSFKDQVKGKNLQSYNRLYERLLKDPVSHPADYKYFYNLSQLFFPIRDNHLSFYQVANFPGETDFPTFAGNVDSRQSVLASTPMDSLEGIYYYDEYLSVGLYKSGKAEYKGVILDSKVPNWKPGQLAIYLYEYEPQSYKAIYVHPKFKNYLFHPIERFTHHSLINSYFYSSFSEKTYSKKKGAIDYINLPKSRPNFILEHVATDIQYVQVKQFSANPSNMQKSLAFYDSIKNRLTEPHLILDLRNNEGGADKVSDHLLRLMKTYTKSGKVYVLVNNGTLSQGEVITLQLKQLKNVKIIGQTTKGMLTYGSNYGNRTKLPSQSFEVYLTDMKGKKKHLAYENYGITPDLRLSDTKDWIQQTIELIQKN